MSAQNVMKVEGLVKGKLGEATVYLGREKYAKGFTCFQAYCISKFDEDDYFVEPYSTLTVNLPGLKENEIAIDVNNSPFAAAMLLDCGFLGTLSRYENSGYNSYPVYELSELAMTCENQDLTFDINECILDD